MRLEVRTVLHILLELGLDRAEVLLHAEEHESGDDGKQTQVPFAWFGCDAARDELDRGMGALVGRDLEEEEEEESITATATTTATLTTLVTLTTLHLHYTTTTVLLCYTPYHTTSYNAIQY